MGTRSSSKQSKHPTRRVIGLIQNSKFKIQNNQAHIRLIIILCVLCSLCVKISPAQTPENFGDQIKNGNSEQKRNALFALRNLRSEEASRIAIPALRDADEIVRATAAFSVIFLPKDEAFNALAPNLQDKAEIVRRETSYALGKVQNSSAVPILIQTFQNRKEKSVEVKNAVVLALGEIGDVSAVDFLTQILEQKPKDDNEFLRRSAARSIGQIAQIIQIQKSRVVTPESFLPEKYKLLTLEKYENLTTNFPQFRNSLAVLTQVLQNTKESDDAKREAAFAIGAIGDVSARPILEKNINAKDYYLAEICKEAVKKLTPNTNNSTVSGSR